MTTLHPNLRSANPYPVSRNPLLLWLLPLAWCALIFWVSGRPIPEVPDPKIPHLDKILHMGVYGILALLWLTALQANLPSLTRRRAALIAFSLTLLYGVSDEYHQSHVPARTADPIDLAADAAGGCVVFVLPRRFRATGRVSVED